MNEAWTEHRPLSRGKPWARGWIDWSESKLDFALLWNPDERRLSSHGSLLGLHYACGIMWTIEHLGYDPNDPELIEANRKFEEELAATRIRPFGPMPAGWKRRWTSWLHAGREHEYIGFDFCPFHFEYDYEIVRMHLMLWPLQLDAGFGFNWVEVDEHGNEVMEA